MKMNLIYMKMNLKVAQFPYEWFCMGTCFDSQAQGNSEMAYGHGVISCDFYQLYLKYKDVIVVVIDSREKHNCLVGFEFQSLCVIERCSKLPEPS